MTRWYWRTVNKCKGLLIEEFHAVKREATKGNNKRHIDGVIVLGEKSDQRGPRKGDRELVKGKRVIVIQSKARRLGMSLIGQVVVSRELLKDLKANVIKSVGVCREDDKVLHSVLRRFKKCEAVVYKRTRNPAVR
jgi:uncharacterized protein (DUF608 family)